MPKILQITLNTSFTKSSPLLHCQVSFCASLLLTPYILTFLPVMNMSCFLWLWPLTYCLLRLKYPVPLDQFHPSSTYCPGSISSANFFVHLSDVSLNDLSSNRLYLTYQNQENLFTIHFYGTLSCPLNNHLTFNYLFLIANFTPLL